MLDPPPSFCWQLMTLTIWPHLSPHSFSPHSIFPPPSPLPPPFSRPPLTPPSTYSLNNGQPIPLLLPLPGLWSREGELAESENCGVAHKIDSDSKALPPPALFPSIPSPSSPPPPFYWQLKSSLRWKHLRLPRRKTWRNRQSVPSTVLETVCFMT